MTEDANRRDALRLAKDDAERARSYDEAIESARRREEAIDRSDDKDTADAMQKAKRVWSDDEPVSDIAVRTVSVIYDGTEESARAIDSLRSSPGNLVTIFDQNGTIMGAEFDQELKGFDAAVQASQQPLYVCPVCGSHQDIPGHCAGDETKNHDLVARVRVPSEDEW